MSPKSSNYMNRPHNSDSEVVPENDPLGRPLRMVLAALFDVPLMATEDELLIAARKFSKAWAAEACCLDDLLLTDRLAALQADLSVARQLGLKPADLLG